MQREKEGRKGRDNEGRKSEVGFEGKRNDKLICTVREEDRLVDVNRSLEVNQHYMKTFT